MCRPVVIFICVVYCAAVLGKREIFTENEVKYTFFPYTNASIIRFKVKAGNDVHVGLTTGPSESDPMIEVVIGGWSNTNSVIRRRFRTIPEKVTIETPGILSAGEYRGFWVRWDAGIITVGRVNEASPFMTWPDPSPFKVTYVGLHTGFGATGNWIIEDPEPAPTAAPSPPLDTTANNGAVSNKVTYKEIYTADEVKYTFFPYSSNIINFKVKAANDVHVGLTTGALEFEPMIEVVIGGWGNTKSVIRRRFRNVPEKFTVETRHIVDPGKFRGFWVRWDAGVIDVGREGADVPFMSWADPDPFHVTHVGLHTGFGSTGSWKIEEPSPNSGASNAADSPCCKCCHKKPQYHTKDVQTGDNTIYTFFPYSKNSVNFKVKAANDVHIGLTSGPEELEPMIEIVFGGWTNTKSVIRRRFKNDPDKVSAETPGIINKSEFRGFWVRWERGIILVGREDSTSPFMSWEDPEPFHVTHIGVHTGFGSTGTWKIEDPSSTALAALDDNPPDDFIDSLCCKCCNTPLPLSYTTSAPAFTNSYKG